MRLIMLGLLAGGAAAAEVTYTRDIAPIFQAKCQQCHRPNDIAPFALDSFQAAFDYKDAIKHAVEERHMPPWKPVEGYGEFRDVRALTAEQRRLILEWVDTGAAKGDDAGAPPPPPETGEWLLGAPDAVLGMPEPFEPPAGKDLYRCFVLPTGFTQTQFVSAVDVVPGERSFVHHVILYLDVTGESEALDSRDPGPGYTCFGGPGTSIPATLISMLSGSGMTAGGWVPGARPSHLPDGIAMQIPPRSRLVMQIHYSPNHRTAPDQTKVGLYFAKGAVSKRLIAVPIVPIERGRVRMEIPAGAKEHHVDMEFPIPFLLDSHLVNITPHMHLLGRKIQASVALPRGGGEKPLILIDDWDFHWQGEYTYKEAVALPAFSRVKVRCTYDNSEANPKNPNTPPKTVTWGEATEDEMCLMILGLTIDRDTPRN